MYSKDKLETSRIEQLVALPNWSWDPINDSWNRSFELLNKYAEEFGHSRVPQNSSYQEVRLGTWVSKQRGSYREGRLDRKKIELLESMPNWVWNPFEEDWEVQFSLLVDFLEREGHIRVPSGLYNDGENLDRWIKNQRANYKRDRLTPEQIKRLESLPDWRWSLRQDSWEQSFDSLKKYVQKNGHSRVLQDYILDGFHLGTWVNKQRGFYKRGGISEDRRNLLEGLPGWTWSPRLARKEEAFDLLQEFTNREGHAHVPAAHIEQGFPLGQWVTSRRQTYKRGKMLAAEQQRLENIPGWTWSTRE
jgi:hypothetical protein